MTWTAPRTWVTGEIVTASEMNTDIRDNTGELKDTVQADGGATLEHRHLTGTLASRPAAGNAGRFYTVTSGVMQGVAYRDDGTNWAPLGVQVAKRDTATEDVVSKTTLTTVFSETIKAGDLGTTGGLRVTLGGDLLKNTDGSLALRITLGTTTPLVGTFALTSDANRRKWTWTILMLNNASASAQKWVTELQAVGAGAAWAVREGGFTQSLHAIGSATSAENTGGDLLLDITAQWDANSVNLSFRKEMAVLELLPALT